MTLNTFIATLLSLAALLVGSLAVNYGVQMFQYGAVPFATMVGIPQEATPLATDSSTSEVSAVNTPPTTLSGQGQVTPPPLLSGVSAAATLAPPSPQVPGQGKVTTQIPSPPASNSKVLITTPPASQSPASIQSVSSIPSIVPMSGTPQTDISYFTSGVILSVSSDTLTIATHDPGSTKIIKRSIHLTSATKIFHMVQKDQDTFEKELQAFREHPPESLAVPPQIFKKVTSDKSALIVDKSVDLVVDKDVASGQMVTALSIEVSDQGPPAPL